MTRSVKPIVETLMAVRKLVIEARTQDYRGDFLYSEDDLNDELFDLLFTLITEVAVSDEVVADIKGRVKRQGLR